MSTQFYGSMPFANSVRQQPINRSQFGLGAFFQRLGGAQPTNNALQTQVRQEPTQQQAAEAIQALRQGRQTANPFEGNEQYQALMEYQKSMAPSQEQQDRLGELRTAFEGTGAYKDYRINQLQNQIQQRPRNPMMGMGLGGMRPMGMQPYQGFGRPPMQQAQPIPMQQPMRQFGAMGYNQPQQQQYMNPYQQMRPQPQQYGGYGMGQQMGGYGSYGQMPNPYQPRQFGNNTNNSMNYSQPAQNQFQGYGGNMAQQQAVY